MSRSMATTGEAKNQGEGDQGVRTLDYTVDAHKKLVTVRFRNKLSFREIQHYADSLRADPAFEPTFSEIADLTEVEQLDLNAEDFLQLADKSDPFSPEAKRAFVARSTAQNHAARMHKILRVQRNFRIFPTIEQAELWISK